MKINGLRILLALLAILAAPRQATAAFVYQPFPELPTTTVKESPFLSRLLASCQALEASPQFDKRKDPPKTCGVAESVRAAAPPASTKLPEQLAEARKDCSATTQNNAEAIFRFLQDLKQTCGKLRRVKALDLDAADLQRLRVARDTPEILTLPVTWRDNEFDNFKAAIEGSQGKGASGDVPGIPSLGTLSDQLIRGMAEFLQKRAQEEALRYLRTQLKTALCDQEGEDGALRKAVFNNVCAALNTLDDGMSLQAIGSYIRAAAEKDLRKLPDASLAYVEYANPSFAPLTFSARLGIASFDALKAGRAPLDALYSLGDLDQQSCEAKGCSEVSRAVRLASAFAYALRQGGTDWQDAFEGLKAEDRAVAGVALILLAEKRSLPPEAKVDVGFVVDEALVNRMLLDPLGFVADAVALVKSWQSLEDRLKKANTEDLRRELLAEAMERASEALFDMVETLDRMRSGQHSATLVASVQRARTFVGVTANLARRQYAPAIVTTLEQLQSMSSTSALPPGVQKYLPLLVEIASAQSSNDVAAAFDAYAAPLGTYELKYRRTFLAINGFFGFQYGRERIDSEGVKATARSFGGFAPVGIHVTTPIGELFHLGAMLSVLDLGAITTIRGDKQPEGTLDGATMGKPETDSAAEIGFQQVFSPGAYLTLGLFKSPAVVGFGISLSPELREVHQDGVTEKLSALRYGVFAAVDVPIFPLN